MFGRWLRQTDLSMHSWVSARFVANNVQQYQCDADTYTQGASVAAAFLAQSPTAVKFAVFICAALIPPSAATTDNLVRTIGTFGHIDLPTLHCVGQHDTCYGQSVQLSKSCESSLGEVLVLPGGHDVPRDDVTSKNIARAIEKCARKAMARC